MKRFHLRQTAAGWGFNLKAPNGEIIATSEVYTTRSKCLDGIESVRHNVLAPTEDQTRANFEVLKFPKYQVYTDKAGEFRFRLCARNGEIIAVSEGYTSKQNCLLGIESVKRNAPEAPITEPDE